MQLVNYYRAKEQPKICMRGLQQLWSTPPWSPRESPKLSFFRKQYQQKTEIRVSHRSLQSPLRGGEAYCRDSPQNCWRNEFSPLSIQKEIQRFKESQVNERQKGQDEQTEQLILENINNVESRRINSSWRALVGNNNKRLLWKSRPGKSLEPKIFIITENKYSIQD